MRLRSGRVYGEDKDQTPHPSPKMYKAEVIPRKILHMTKQAPLPKQQPPELSLFRRLLQLLQDNRKIILFWILGSIVFHFVCFGLAIMRHYKKWEEIPGGKPPYNPLICLHYCPEGDGISPRPPCKNLLFGNWESSYCTQYQYRYKWTALQIHGKQKTICSLDNN